MSTDVKIEPEAHALARADRTLTLGGSVFIVFGVVRHVTCYELLL